MLQCIDSIASMYYTEKINFKWFFFFPLMEFPINFKTIMEAHLVPSRSRTRVQKHQVLILTQPQPHKILLFKPKKKKKKKQKHGDMETGSGTAFLRLYFQDWFLGPQSQDYGNRECIYRTTFPRSQESGLHFKYHGSGMAFLQLLKQD